MKNRTYIVWIKGQRISTERRIEASHKINALIKLASMYGIKSYECDGLLVR